MKTIRSPRPLFPVALFLCWLLVAPQLTAPLNADTHGPICSWHQDPATTMTVQWIESRSYPRNEWFSAPSGFGYGDDDDATIVSPAAHGRLYVRHTFAGEQLAGATELLLKLRYDDAFIAYLNGQEIARAGVTEVQDDDDADGTRLEIASHEADEVEDFPIANFAELLQADDNVLAIVGFNVSSTSSDFTLHPALVMKRDQNATETDVIPWSAQWNVFRGGEPEAGWQTLTAQAAPANQAEPSRYELTYRQLSGNPEPDESAASWQIADVEQHPFADSASFVFFANLAKLQPDTRYQFQLKQQGESGTTLRGPFEFQTAPAQREDPLKFVTGGDMFHSRELLDAMNACAGRLDPLFALLGGDLAYANARNAERWYAWVDSWHENAVAPDGRLVPMILAIGNHETSGPDPEDAKFFYSLFQLPAGKTNYAVDFGDYLSIVLLDSDHSQRVAAQTQWLESALAARSSVPDLFVCYHRPTYGTIVKTDQPAIRTEWVPLFERYHASAVFENDHHVYKRTLPIRQGEVDNDRGVLYLGDGAWGVQVREIPAEVNDLEYMAAWASKNHLIEVVISDTSRIYTARTADGSGFDSVTDTRRRQELLNASSGAPDERP